MKPSQALYKSLKPITQYLLFPKTLTTSPLNNSTIINNLISIFTKQPFSPENPELKRLSPFLNPRIVETVLNSFKSWKIAYIFFHWASTQHGYKHNMYAYNAMASILSRVRQNAPLKVLCTDIVNSRCLMSPGALGYLLRCLGSVGLVYEANLLFDRVVELSLCVPNGYSYNCLLEAVSKFNDVGLVEMRLKEMRDCGWEPDKYTLTPLLRVYCNVDECDKALRIFDEICQCGLIDQHACSILVLAFSKWGRVDKALELIERMEDWNVVLNEKTFRVLIHGFVKESRVDEALFLFNKMKKYNFVPDVSLYDVLIGGLCMNKEFEKASNLYLEMKNLDIKPDVGIVTKLISFSPEEDLASIFELIHRDVDVGSETLICNSVLYNFVNNGSLDKACSLLKRMIGDDSYDDADMHKFFRGAKLAPPNSTSFILVMDGLIKAGKLDLALIVFQGMERSGCERSISLFNNLIEGLCNSNRLEECCELLGKMEESGLEPTQFTHNALFGCFCRRNDVVGALAVVKRMRAHGHEPWTKHSTSMVKSLCEHGMVLEACRFLDDMVQEGFSPNVIAYSASLDGLIKIHEVDQALKLFQGICDRGHCPDVVTYNILIKGLCKAQRVSEAENLFKEMLIKGLVPSVVTYNLLIDGWCKNGQIDEALLLLSKMSGKERKPNVITYTTLIDGLCNAGRPDEAVTLWNDMKDHGCTPTSIAFMAFIHGLCKCGRPDEALVHLREMQQEELKPDTYIYIALLSACLSKSDLPLAFEILEEMVEKGYLPDPLDKNYAIVRDAIPKLLEDTRISFLLMDLISKGGIPTVNPCDHGCEVDPT